MWMWICGCVRVCDASVCVCACVSVCMPFVHASVCACVFKCMKGISGPQICFGIFINHHRVITVYSGSTQVFMNVNVPGQFVLQGYTAGNSCVGVHLSCNNTKARNGRTGGVECNGVHVRDCVGVRVHDYIAVFIPHNKTKAVTACTLRKGTT